jgi:membrane protein DedA with SNARE-associated domain
VTNPKNLALTVAGCMAIRQGQLSLAGSGLMLLLFTFISSLGIAIPVLVYLSGGDGAQATVERWKHILTRHQKTVMALLFLVFGIALLYRGLKGY